MTGRDEQVERLRRAGSVFAEDEWRELEAAAADPAALESMVDRRCAGEPLPWIVGSVEFGGLRVRIDPGVYVPRPHSELLAEEAARRLPTDGRAIDLCTGCGAVAAVLVDRRPTATIVGTELDATAAECAHRNGVDVVIGDLFTGVDQAWRGCTDVIVGVLPYVPGDELEFLARDALDHEPVLALDGGDAGLSVVRRAIAEAPAWLRPGGALVLEVGGTQPELLARDLTAASFSLVEILRDEDGDPRGIVATSAG